MSPHSTGGRLPLLFVLLAIILPPLVTTTNLHNAQQYTRGNKYNPSSSATGLSWKPSTKGDNNERDVTSEDNEKDLQQQKDTDFSNNKNRRYLQASATPGVGQQSPTPTASVISADDDDFTSGGEGGVYPGPPESAGLPAPIQSPMFSWFATAALPVYCRVRGDFLLPHTHPLRLLAYEPNYAPYRKYVSPEIPSPSASPTSSISPSPSPSASSLSSFVNTTTSSASSTPITTTSPSSLLSTIRNKKISEYNTSYGPSILFYLGQYSACDGEVGRTYPMLADECTSAVTLPFMHRSTNLGLDWTCETVPSRAQSDRTRYLLVAAYQRQLNSSSSLSCNNTTDNNNTSSTGIINEFSSSNIHNNTQNYTMSMWCNSTNSTSGSRVSQSNICPPDVDSIPRPMHDEIFIFGQAALVFQHNGNDYVNNTSNSSRVYPASGAENSTAWLGDNTTDIDITGGFIPRKKNNWLPKVPSPPRCDLMCVFGGKVKIQTGGSGGGSSVTLPPSNVSTTARRFLSQTSKKTTTNSSFGSSLPSSNGYINVATVTCCRLPECLEWVDQYPLPTPTSYSTAVQFENDIYILGGIQDTGQSSMFRSTVIWEEDVLVTVLDKSNASSCSSSQVSPSPSSTPSASAAASATASPLPFVPPTPKGRCYLGPWSTPITSIPMAPNRVEMMASSTINLMGTTNSHQALLVGGGLTISDTPPFDPLYPNADIWQSETPSILSSWKMLTPSLPLGDPPGGNYVKEKLTAILDFSSFIVNNQPFEQPMFWTYAVQKPYVLLTTSTPPRAITYANMLFPDPTSPTPNVPLIRNPVLIHDPYVIGGYPTVFAIHLNQNVAEGSDGVSPTSTTYTHQLLRIDVMRCSDTCNSLYPPSPGPIPPVGNSSTLQPPTHFYSVGCTTSPHDAGCYECRTCDVGISRSVKACKTSLFNGYGNTRCKACSSCGNGYKRSGGCNDTYDTVCTLDMEGGGGGIISPPTIVKSPYADTGINTTVLRSTYILTGAFLVLFFLASGLRVALHRSSSTTKNTHHQRGDPSGTPTTASSSPSSSLSSSSTTTTTTISASTSTTTTTMTSDFKKAMRVMWPLMFSITSLLAHLLLGISLFTIPRSSSSSSSSSASSYSEGTSSSPSGLGSSQQQSTFIAAIAIIAVLLLNIVGNVYFASFARRLFVFNNHSTTSTSAGMKAASPSSVVSRLYPYFLLSAAMFLHARCLLLLLTPSFSFSSTSTSSNWTSSKLGNNSIRPRAPQAGDTTTVHNDTSSCASTDDINANSNIDMSGGRHATSNSSSQTTNVDGEKGIQKTTSSSQQQQQQHSFTAHYSFTVPMRVVQSFALRWISLATITYDVPLLLTCVILLGSTALGTASPAVILCAFLDFVNILVTLSWAVSVATKLKAIALMSRYNASSSGTGGNNYNGSGAGGGSSNSDNSMMSPLHAVAGGNDNDNGSSSNNGSSNSIGTTHHQIRNKGASALHNNQNNNKMIMNTNTNGNNNSSSNNGRNAIGTSSLDSGIFGDNENYVGPHDDYSIQQQQQKQQCAYENTTINGAIIENEGAEDDDTGMSNDDINPGAAITTSAENNHYNYYNNNHDQEEEKGEEEEEEDEIDAVDTAFFGTSFRPFKPMMSMVNTTTVTSNNNSFTPTPMVAAVRSSNSINNNTTISLPSSSVSTSTIVIAPSPCVSVSSRAAAVEKAKRLGSSSGTVSAVSGGAGGGNFTPTTTPSTSTNNNDPAQKSSSSQTNQQYYLPNTLLPPPTTQHQVYPQREGNNDYETSDSHHHHHASSASSSSASSSSAESSIPPPPRLVAATTVRFTLPPPIARASSSTSVSAAAPSSSSSTTTTTTTTIKAAPFVSPPSSYPHHFKKNNNKMMMIKKKQQLSINDDGASASSTASGGVHDDDDDEDGRGSMSASSSHESSHAQTFASAASSSTAANVVDMRLAINSLRTRVMNQQQ